MLIDSFIFFIFCGEVLLVAYKKLAQQPKLARWRFLVVLLLIAFCCFNLWNVYSADNHFKFLNIPRDFTEEQVHSATKMAMAKYHPDQPTGDNDSFIKVSELKEIYDTKRGKNMFKLHQFFGVDPREIFYDKFSSKNFETFQLEVFNSFAFNSFAIFLAHVLLFEEVSGSTTLLFVSVLFFTGGFPMEGAIFGHHLWIDFHDMAMDFIEDRTWLSQLTLMQVASFFKVLIASIGFLALIIYFEVKSLRHKQKFDQIWDQLRVKIKSGQFKPEEAVQEIGLFSKKVEKRVKNFEKEMRTVNWALILAPIGIGVTMLGVIPKVVLWVIKYFNIKIEGVNL